MARWTQQGAANWQQRLVALVQETPASKDKPEDHGLSDRKALPQSSSRSMLTTNGPEAKSQLPERINIFPHRS